MAGALTSLGIPNDTVIEYESRIEAGSFILLIHGDEKDTLNAKKLLESHSDTKLESFSTPEKAGAL